MITRTGFNLPTFGQERKQISPRKWASKKEKNGFIDENSLCLVFMVALEGETPHAHIPRTSIYIIHSFLWSTTSSARTKNTFLFKTERTVARGINKIRRTGYGEQHGPRLILALHGRRGRSKKLDTDRVSGGSHLLLLILRAMQTASVRKKSRDCGNDADTGGRSKRQLDTVIVDQASCQLDLRRKLAKRRHGVSNLFDDLTQKVEKNIDQQNHSGPG